MAITNRTELDAAIIQWTNRSDLTTATLDSFVQLAEARMYDRMILRDTETETPLTATIGSSTIPLPSDYISPISAWLIIDSERYLLNPALPQELPYYPDSTQPKYWAIDGVNLRFDCPCDQAYVVPLRYVKKTALTAIAPTNYVLSRRPDIYLAGALTEAAAFLKDDQIMALWAPRFVKACADFMATENRARGIVPLRTDVPTAKGYRANIYRGDY